MFMIGNHNFFAIYVTFGFTGHVQVLVRRNTKTYKMINLGFVDHAKCVFPC